MSTDAVKVMWMDGHGSTMECQGIPVSVFVISNGMCTTILSDWNATSSSRARTTETAEMTHGAHALNGNTIANVTEHGSVKSIGRTVSMSSIVIVVGANLEIGIAVFVKHVMHNCTKSWITRADGNGTTVVLKGVLESDFVVGRVTDLVLRDTGDVSWMMVGITIEIVIKSKCRRGIGSVRMDERCRRKGSTTWKWERTRTFRITLIIRINLSIAITISSIAIDAESFADTPNPREPFVDVTENLTAMTFGARAPGAAVTPRRYRPLALPTKERGVWLTWRAWLRRALRVSWYMNFVIALGTLLTLWRVRRLPLATARARAMARVWLGMAMAAAGAAKSLALARSSCASWEDAAARPTATRIVAYSNGLMMRRETPLWNSAVLPTDGFHWGETEGIITSFTPGHITGGLGILTFLALVVLPSTRGRTTGTTRSTGAITIITIGEAGTNMKTCEPLLGPRGVGPSSSSSCAGRAPEHEAR